MKFGILTVSDSCYRSEKIDYSGKKLKELIEISFPTHPIIYESIVPDSVDKISEKLIEWSNNECDIILTTGGTGIASTDVTPDATKAVIDTIIPGITYAMLNNSLEKTPYAMLSRAVSGICKKSLIINFPGSVKAVTENFYVINTILPHAMALIQNKKLEIAKDHDILQNVTSTQNLSPSKVIISNVAARDRFSSYNMIEVDKAIEIITGTCEQTSDLITVDIMDALGRVLAEDVRSLDSLPPFAASIKDGYAVKTTDGVGEREVFYAITAGDDPNGAELQSGYCVRVSTGAPIPPGADAVVQVEDTVLVSTTPDSLREFKVNIKVAPIPYQDIRLAGSDIEAHTVVLTKGKILNAPEIGVLAAIGKMKVKIFKPPTIGVISTGNEIQNPAKPLEIGRIRDSNKITLLTLLKQYSYTAQDFGQAKDEPTILKHTLAKCFDKCDIVITTGGVSMGELDLMRSVLITDFKAIIHFGRVNMKPGKPLTFATCIYNEKIKTIFALPGNPVSATVTCVLFVIPALRYIENANKIFFKKVLVESTIKVKPDKHRPEYQRVKFNTLNNSQYVSVTPTGNQISSKLNSFVGADGLMIVPPNRSDFGPYECYILNNY